MMMMMVLLLLMMIYLAVLIEHQFLTDGRTEEQRGAIAYCASIVLHVKND